jgi:hypothetical protein
VHYTRKAINKKGAEASKIEKKLSSKRKAPQTHDGGSGSAKCKYARIRTNIASNVIRHVKFQKSNTPPNEVILQRVRSKVAENEAKRKAQKEEVYVEPPSKASNETSYNISRTSKTDYKKGEGSHGDTTLARRKLIEELAKQAKVQAGKANSHKNSRNSTASYSRQKVAKAGNQGSDHDCKFVGVTEAKMTKGGNRTEQQAITRLLALKR